MENPNKIILSEPVFAYLKPTIFIMRIFGLAPVSYKLVKKYYVIERSMKYTIYSFVIAIILGSLTIHGLIQDYNSEKSIRMKLTKQRYIVISDIGIVVCSVFFGVIMGPYKLSQLLNVLQCFHKINLIMNESVKKFKEEEHMAIIIGLSVYSIFFCVLALDIYCWINRLQNVDEKFSYFRDYTSFYILYLLVMCQELSYCLFTYYVRRRMMALNAVLVQEIQKQPDVFLHKLKPLKKHIDAQTTTDQGCIYEKHVLSSSLYSFTDEITPQKVTNLMRVHGEIFTSVNSINDCFGYPLLCIMTSCLLHLVITPFFFIAGHNTEFLFSLLQIVWISVHLGRLFIIVEPTHRCLEECEKTNPLIIQLMSKVEDKHVLQKLEIFALQGQVCVVQFSSCGIVNIKRSVLASIASAVTTYLVILIQLNNN